MDNDTGSGRTTLSWGRGHVRHGRIPEWLIESDASDKAVRVYALLATYADRDGRAFPGRKRIMERLGIGLTSYKGAIRDLVRVGALTVTERERDDGSRTTNLYTLHWTPPLDSGVVIATGDGREGDRGTGAEATDSRARDPLTLELGKTVKEETLAADAADATPPRLTKIDGRDLAFDTLAEVCGVDPAGNRAREVGIALNGRKGAGGFKGIRTLVWERRDDRAATGGEGFERYLVDAIESAARVYRVEMDGARLTPLALAKWWTDLGAGTSRRESPAQAAMREAVRLAEQGR
jgi:hypothetical protein